MNFRAIDPTDSRAGLTGASSTDREVWAKFFDPIAGQLTADDLEVEFNRLWADESAQPTRTVDASAEIESFQRETEKLTKLSLEQLFDRLRANGANDKKTKIRKPKTRNLSQRVFDRNPLIVAITKRFAEFKCEVPDCGHSTFLTQSSEPYVEAHHIQPLAEGGYDSLENLVCICPAHHAEAHLGVSRDDLKQKLLAYRGENPIICTKKER